jgi:LPXTG-motif cell wall-anchored protein
VEDTLSKGLTLTGDVTVSSGSVGSKVTKGTPANGFTVDFTSADIAALTEPQEVEITYKAILTEEAFTSVNEEENEVTVKFSNDPTDKTKKNIVKDETREYTFSIDGSLFGDSSYKTGELVKVGLDAEGNPVESYQELDNGSEHAALSGAVFGLYTDEGCTKLYKNDKFTGEVTTAPDGTMEINGLKAGTYYLKEISAPTGYIKDSKVHTIVIDAKIENVDVTETVEGIEVTYSVPTLKSYTITIDGNESSYEMTLDGPNLSSVTPAESTSEIVNTKGFALPSTGGIGTTIFYVVGGLLVAMAAVLLVTKRRMGTQK